MRTAKEYDAASQMIESGEYDADQWRAEAKLHKIHESECELCLARSADLKTITKRFSEESDT